MLLPILVHLLLCLASSLSKPKSAQRHQCEYVDLCALGEPCPPGYQVQLEVSSGTQTLWPILTCVSARFYCCLKCHLFKQPWDLRRTCDQLIPISPYQACEERGFSQIKKIPYQAPPTQFGPRKCTFWKNIFFGPKYQS